MSQQNPPFVVHMKSFFISRVSYFSYDIWESLGLICHDERKELDPINCWRIHRMHIGANVFTQSIRKDRH